jgi:uncharacterized membrane protein
MASLGRRPSPAWLRAIWTRLANPLCTAGILVGTLFFALSLAPSLLPRPLVFQGLVSGVSLAAGYLIGAAGRWLWGYLELPLPRPAVSRKLLQGAGVLCLAVAAFFLWRAAAWQNTLRALFGIEPEPGVRPFSVALVALVLFGVLLVLARIFQQLFHFLSVRFETALPPRVARVIGIAAAAAAFYAVAEGVVFSWALGVADRSYQALDALVPGEGTPPASPLRSGSPASQVPWEALGHQGRRFVSEGPRAAELSALLGEPAPDPIRVYVGLQAGESPAERAALALAELERTGAFERAVLLLITPTGTGWVDPAAMLPFEALHRGDVASVAVQYSYLSSPLALLLEGAYGAEAARALFLAVYRQWSRMDPEARPRLYLYGLSLGALNSTLSFDFHDIVGDPFDGALWAGPPFRTEAWAQATRSREPDTPPWLPEYRGGAVVRFMNQDGGLERGTEPWGSFRIAYLQYASDPITFFDARSFFREPDWMASPRGPDVSPEMRWYPVVTMLQLAADMLIGGAPPGYGHTFAVEHYLEAWLALTEPEGWPEAEVERLRAWLIDRMAEPDGEDANGAG